MSDTNLYEDATNAMCWLKRAKQSAQPIKDFGDTTAVQEDLAQLISDTRYYLNSIQIRAWHLVNRCDKISDDSTVMVARPKGENHGN